MIAVTLSVTTLLALAAPRPSLLASFSAKVIVRLVAAPLLVGLLVLFS